MTNTDISSAVVLNTLTPGSLIDLETHSRHYHIECLGGDEIRISGHPHYCPRPTSAYLKGSLDQNGVFQPGRIGPEMRLIFLLNDRPVTTSQVVNVHVHQPGLV
jgi:hypothetical protein